MKKLLLLLLILAAGTARAGRYVHFDTPLYKFRVYLTDKKGTPYSVKHPEQFLSQKSIDRRKRLRLKVDEHDLPLTPAYVDGIQAKGLRVVNKSKWNNTLVVETADTALAQSLTALPYVKGIRRIYTRPDSIAAPDTTDRHSRLTGKLDSTSNYYGHGYAQIQMLNGLRLHEAGLRGQGMTIAVIDGGFYNADILPGLKGTRILGTRNFVNDDPDVYAAHWHGMMVLACIGARASYSLVGTAPEASFYLLMSEDTPTEHMVEEDNWCAAVEYADSLGVDIITSSLGYYTYDDPAESHTYRELDGRTALNSRTASLAASRGILVLNSAGNAGNDRWKKISVPADATDILTVGAVDSLRRNTLFSSLGNTADGRIKPDVMALGEGAAAFEVDGSIIRVNGTSFSTPILCGMVACLWQAFPDRRPEEIIDAVRRSADNADHPDNVYGYGIPDMWKAYQFLDKK